MSPFGSDVGTKSTSLVCTVSKLCAISLEFCNVNGKGMKQEEATSFLWCWFSSGKTKLGTRGRFVVFVDNQLPTRCARIFAHVKLQRFRMQTQQIQHAGRYGVPLRFWRYCRAASTFETTKYRLNGTLMHYVECK